MTNQIVLKFNNVAVNEPCAICGARTDAGIGIELFAENTGRLICEPCADKHAPDLKQARDILAEETNVKKIYPEMFQDDKGELTYVNVCQYCPSVEDLRPITDHWGNVTYICRECLTKAAQAGRVNDNHK